MTTVADVIERIYRDYLLPPGEQPARFVVGTGGIDASATTLPVDLGMLSPEEQDLIGAGTVIEAADELMLVEAVDNLNDPPESLTVRRGMYGTDAAAHAAGVLVTVAPDFPRRRVFLAVADAIEGLWPDLYTIDVEEAWAQPIVELPATVGAVIDIRAYVRGGWVPLEGWDYLPGFPHSSTGVAVQVGVDSGTALHIKVRKIPQRPEAETDTLSDLGVDEGWVKVVAVMATAEMMASEDIDRATVQFITQALESEGFQVGQGADLRNALLQYADFLSAPLRRRLTMQERPRVVLHRGF